MGDLLVEISAGYDAALLAAAAALALLAALAALVVHRGRHRSAAVARPAAELADQLRGAKVMGLGAALIFAGGLGGWSALVPLDSAAIAPGVVSPDGLRKTVQHLEGGIIRSIHVREGDIVEAGAALITLEDKRARGEFDKLRERYVHLLAAEARLEAEQAGAAAIEFPAIMEVLAPQEARRAIATHQQLFADRRAAREGERQILTQRIRQLDEEIAGLRAVIAAEDEQLGYVAQEIANVEDLYRKGLERLPRLLALQRQQAEIRASRAGNVAAIARNEQKIGETKIQLLNLGQRMVEEVGGRLTEVRTELATLRTQMRYLEDMLKRTVVRAPTRGTVMNLRVTTETGVVGPGAPLLDIVPSEAQLVIDARVRPTDIDVLHPGLRARVVLSAYRTRNLPPIFGTLRSVSADRLVDERSGEAYFLAKIEVDPDELAALGGEVRLSPGMPAEVMILTGEQTVFDYLLDPLVNSVRRSFREG